MFFLVCVGCRWACCCWLVGARFGGGDVIVVGVVGGDLLGLTESVLALVPRRCVHEAAVAALRELEMSWVVSR